MFGNWWMPEEPKWAGAGSAAPGPSVQQQKSIDSLAAGTVSENGLKSESFAGFRFFPRAEEVWTLHLVTVATHETAGDGETWLGLLKGVCAGCGREFLLSLDEANCLTGKGRAVRLFEANGGRRVAQVKFPGRFVAPCAAVSQRPEGARLHTKEELVGALGDFLPAAK